MVTGGKRKKKSRVFVITLALSVLVHLIIFMEVSGLFQIRALSVIELTMKEELKPSFRNIPRPPKRHREKSPDNQARPTEKTVMQEAPMPRDIKPETVPAMVVTDDRALGVVAEGIVAAVPSGLPQAGTGSGTGTRSGFGTAKEYYQMVQMRIEAKKQYPKTARQQNQEGRVTVYFIVGPDGGISDLKIVKGSRFKILDEAALEAVRNSAHFPVPPPALFQGPVKLQLSILFELT